MKALSSLSLLIFSACAAPAGSTAETRRTIDAPAEVVTRAAESVLGGTLQTDWRLSEEPSHRLLGVGDEVRERTRVVVTPLDADRTAVEVRVDVERRPRNTSQGIRWNREFSDGKREARFFEQLEEALR